MNPTAEAKIYIGLADPLRKPLIILEYMPSQEKLASAKVLSGPLASFRGGQDNMFGLQKK